MRIPQWDYLSWASDRFGRKRALLGYPRALLTRKAKINMGGRPVYLRTGTSDLEVWNSVFVKLEYAVGAGEPKFIIDAGAHIGLSAIYFAHRYPDATIVAVELDKANYRLLVRNTAGYANIRPMHAGLWSHQTLLDVENPGADTWSFRATEGGKVPAVTVDQLLADCGRDRVDLLKIDIEGGEREVMQNAEPWIDRVGTLVIELHDRFAPGCSQALRDAVGSRPFRHSQSGENVVLQRLPLATSADFALP